MTRTPRHTPPTIETLKPVVGPAAVSGAPFAARQAREGKPPPVTANAPVHFPMRNFISEEDRAGYTSDTSSPQAADTQRLEMRKILTPEILEAAERELAKRRGLTLAQYRAALDAAASPAAAEPKAAPRPDWIEARARGDKLADFIEEKFKAELASGEMHRGLLSRYDELQGDFYSLRRSKGFPARLKNLPTLSEWNTQQLKKRRGNVPSGRGSVRPDEARLYDAARYRAKADM